MKLFVSTFFCFGLAALMLGLPAGEARADTVPDCLEAETGPKVEGAGQAWWDRRTAQEQNMMRTLPCKERYIVAVCIFLQEPDLNACVNKGVSRKRAAVHCAQEGHEILSKEMAACESAFVQNSQPVF